MVLPILPLVERFSKRLIPLAGLCLLAVVSAGMQVLGWAIDFNIFHNEIRKINPMAEATIMITEPQYSPITGHFQLIRKELWDIALLKITPTGIVFQYSVAIDLLLFGAAGLFLALRVRPSPIVSSGYCVAAILAIGLISNQSLHAYAGDLRFGPSDLHQQILDYDLVSDRIYCRG